MRKRILSLALAGILALGGSMADAVWVSAAQIGQEEKESVQEAGLPGQYDAKEEAVSQEAELPERYNAEGEAAQEDGSTEEYNAAAVREDVEIEGLDVPYKTVEWGISKEAKRGAQAKRGNEIILVLDVSGSMSGEAMAQLKKACYNFIDDIFAEDPSAGIGIVAYESSVTSYTFQGEYFTSDRNELRSVVNGLTANGGTAMNAGILNADRIMQDYGTADNRFLIQMADGGPNEGETYYGEDARYVENGYCSAIYNTFLGIQDSYHIYSLGFFHSYSGAEKQFAAAFMNDIQNRGYFEVTDADKLTFSFEDIAENINSDMISFNKSSLVLAKGSRETLTVSFSSAYPSSDRTVAWASSNPAIAEVDAKGRVRAASIGNCVITASAGGYRISCPVTVKKENSKLDEITVNIKQNEHIQAETEKYVASPEATITYNGTKYCTNEQGKAVIPKIQSGELTISKSGFVTRSVPASFVKDGRTFCLQKESENPVINAVWADGKDVISEEHEVSLDRSDSMVFSADVAWGKSGRKSLQLAQEATFVDFTESNTLSMVLKTKFDVSKDIYIIATDGAGHVTKLKLKFQVSSKINGLEGLELSFGDKIALTLPEAIPFLGGSEVGLDLEDGVLPVSVAVSDGKVHAAIGLDMASYSQEWEKDTGKEEPDENYKETKKEIETLNFIEQVKSIKNMKGNLQDSAKEAADKVKNLKQEYKNALEEKKGKLGVDAGVTIMGYAEFYIDGAGKLQMTEGGVVLAFSASAKWSGNSTVLVVVPVPVYWEASIAGEIEGAFHMSRSGETSKYMPGGKISASLKGEIGGGVGNTNLFTIGGGGKASLSPNVTFYSDKKNYLSLTTGVNFYFKVTALGIYEKEWEPEVLKKEWTVDNGAESAKSMVQGEGSGKADLYNASAYQQADLDYLSEPGVSMQPAGESGKDPSGKYADKLFTFNGNALSQTSPKMVEFNDGTRLAIWLDAAKNDVNTVKSYYSFYDGVNWSNPTVVDKDDTADFVSDIYVSGRNAYVVWQDARTSISGNSTLAETTDMQIKAAVFDGNAREFQEAVVLNKQGDALPTMPMVCGFGTEVTAVWVENTASDWFLAQGENTIYTSALQEGGWSEPKAAYTGMNAITSLDAYTDGEGLYLAYTVDGDNVLETLEDQEVYLNGTQITDNSAADSMVQFEGAALYWVQNGNVMYTESLTKPEAKPVLATKDEFLFHTYTVLADGDRKAILFAAKDGLKSSLKGVFYQKDKGEWGSPIQLSNPDEQVDITSFSAVWPLAGSLEVLCNKIIVNNELNDKELTKEEQEAYYNNLFGKTELVLMGYGAKDIVSIADCYYDKSEIIADGALPITLSVTNHNMEPLDGVTVKVYDGGEKVESIDIQREVLSGQTQDITFQCGVDPAYIGKELKVQCTPLGKDGIGLDESQVAIGMEYEDLAFENIKWAFTAEDKVTIMGDVKNMGFSDVENVRISLRKGKLDADVIKSVTLKGIAAHDMAQVSFEAPFEEDMVYYITADVPQEDGNAGNDQGFVILQGPKDRTGRTLERITAAIQKNAYIVGEALKLDGLSVEAVYSDGTTAGVATEALIDHSKVNMGKAGTYKIAVSYQGKTTEVAVKVSEKPSADVPNDNKKPTPAPSRPSPANKVKKGDKVTIKKLKYTVASTKNGNRSVTLMGCTDKKSRKNLSIPASVKISGKAYKVTAVNARAFAGCRKLSSLSVGQNVAVIGKEAFAGCKSLKSVKLGALVKRIKAGAFSGCLKLSSIKVVSKKLVTIEKNAFKGISSRARIKVPASKLKAYKKLFSKKSIGYKKGWKIGK